MARILKIFGPGDVRFMDYEEPALQPLEVRLKTLYSGISAGTELTHFRGTNPNSLKTWDDSRRIFLREPNEQYYPRPTGYEEVGQVVKTGSQVTQVAMGDIVFGQWTHKSSHVMSEDLAVKNKLPAGLDPLAGIFAQIGAIGMGAVLDAGIRVSETVAIFGQGTPGLVCTRLAALSGARVIAVDLHRRRRELAKRFGADIVIDPAEMDAAAEIKRLTGFRGADAVIEASGAIPALADAIRCCVYAGTVTALGFYQGGAAALPLGDEFHHNRVSIACTQVGGIKPELSNRWSLERMHLAVMQLQLEGKLPLTELITHRVAFEDALSLYKMIDENPSEIQQAVLCFS